MNRSQPCRNALYQRQHSSELWDYSENEAFVLTHLAKTDGGLTATYRVRDACYITSVKAKEDLLRKLSYVVNLWSYYTGLNTEPHVSGLEFELSQGTKQFGIHVAPVDNATHLLVTLDAETEKGPFKLFSKKLPVQHAAF